MEMTSQWITFKQAMGMIAKSDSTIKRLVKKHNIPIKKEKIDGRIVSFIDRYVLINAIAHPGHRDQSLTQVMTQVNEPHIDPHHDPDRNRYMNHLETLVTKQDNEIRELKEKNDTLTSLNAKLNEELKALLRDIRQRPRGIFGYLVEKITR